MVVLSTDFGSGLNGLEMAVKHWSRCSVYAVARALYEQHDCDWDQAFRMAWYAMRRGVVLDASPFQVLHRMEMVRNVPVVPEGVMLMFQLHLRNVLMGRVEA
jgi:hypothetical protein